MLCYEGVRVALAPSTAPIKRGLAAELLMRREGTGMLEVVRGMQPHVYKWCEFLVMCPHDKMRLLLIGLMSGATYLTSEAPCP